MMDAASRAKTELVVIGASAGALSALTALMPSLPADFAPAVAVVVHVPARGPNLMAAVLSPHSALPILEIEDKEPVTPGTVYLAPADYHVLIESDRRFTLNADDPVNFSRPSIDVLFESAAAVFADRVLGIVLTGANADGALGLRAIRESGGLAVVQDPASAAVPDMPRAAIAAANPHGVLDLPAIGNLLRSLPRRGLKS
jgi:two-component system chemotaxis response regulator CheB